MKVEVLKVEVFFNRLRELFQGGCPNFRPDSDWCALAQSNGTLIDRARTEEALYWIADLTFGRSNFHAHSGENPAQVYGLLLLQFEQIRKDLSLNTEEKRTKALEDLYAALCFGYSCLTEADFKDLAPRRRGSIFAAYANREKNNHDFTGTARHSVTMPA